MAQAVRHDEVELDESLLSQAKEKALLLQKDGNGMKMSGDYVPAGKLTYANPKGWKITEYVAVLIGSHELHVSGNYSTPPHVVGVTYEMSFEVLLKDNCKINEVELTLTPSHGSPQTHTESLKNYARNVPISLKVGKSCGDIKFELKGTECETWKKGLVIFGVLIKVLPLVPGPINADA